MQDVLFLDIETYSDTPIGDGLWAYAESAEVMLLAYTFGDEPVVVLDLTTEKGRADMAELYARIVTEEPLIVAHNAQFDRTVLSFSPYAKLCALEWHCTMAQALAHSLPGGLDKLCQVFKLTDDVSKDKAGRQLINLFCKPRPKNQKLRRATRETNPKEWAEFITYAGADIRSMRELYKKMPRWNLTEIEHAVWALDQTINARGFNVDLELAEKAIEAIDKEQARLAAATSEATDGEVGHATQRDKLLAYILDEHGVELPDMQKSTLERRLNDQNLPQEVRELIGLRLAASTSSTAKYKTLLRAISSDGRLRGTLQYCGANRTGRWAGRTFQPQNLPRPTYKPADIDRGILAMKMGCLDLVAEVMPMTSSAIRGCILPSSGNKLVVSDLSNIEGRVAAWLAGEHWKLDAFRAFDAGTGPDLYKLAYAKAFNIDPKDVTKDQRQIGKVMELALQYEGGTGAFVTFAAAYGLDLEMLANTAMPNVPEDVLDEAQSFYQWMMDQKRSDFGLSPRAYVACEALKRLWRNAHKGISSYWPLLNTTVNNAVFQQDKWHAAGLVKIMLSKGWLRILLPSGRSLCYPSARVEDGKLSYLGVDQYTRKWQRISTYGGKIFENMCQAVARDVMATNMLGVEKAGYKIVLSVHDELLTETPDTKDFTAEKLSALLSSEPTWGKELPLAAGGYEAYRYKKE